MTVFKENPGKSERIEVYGDGVWWLVLVWYEPKCFVCVLVLKVQVLCKLKVRKKGKRLTECLR